MNKIMNVKNKNMLFMCVTLLLSLSLITTILATLKPANASEYDVKLVEVDVDCVKGLEHDYEFISHLTPNCDSDGVGIMVCNNCEVIKKVILPPGGHQLLEPEIIRVGDCRNSAIYTQQCARCMNHELYEDESTLGVHEYGELVILKPSTCVDAGLGEKNCVVCDEVIQIILPNNNHNLSVNANKCAVCGVNVNSGGNNGNNGNGNNGNGNNGNKNKVVESDVVVDAVVVGKDIIVTVTDNNGTYTSTVLFIKSTTLTVRVGNYTVEVATNGNGIKSTKIL